MAGNFIFNRKSSGKMWLTVESKTILNGPEPEVEEYHVPGRDGAVYRFTGRRENVEVSYRTFLKAPKKWDLSKYAADVKRWLEAKPGEYFRLEDTWDPDHFRMAAYVDGLEVENVLRNYTWQAIVFSCLPYRYRKSGEIPVPVEPQSSGVTLYNDTGFDTKPLLRLGFATHDGSLPIRIEYEDGTAYEDTLKGLGQSQTSAVIDSEEEMIRQADGSILHTNTLEKFPVLRPGENKITVGGYITPYWEITPRWREL